MNDSKATKNTIFAPRGRINRTKFLMYSGFLGYAIVFIIAMLLVANNLTKTSFVALLIISLVFVLLALFCMTLALFLSARRLHDLGYHGALSLLLLIPFVGFVMVILLIFAPGKNNPNEYGNPPAAPTRNQTVFAIILYISSILVSLVLFLIIPRPHYLKNNYSQVNAHQLQQAKQDHSHLT